MSEDEKKSGKEMLMELFNDISDEEMWNEILLKIQNISEKEALDLLTIYWAE